MYNYAKNIEVNRLTSIVSTPDLMCQIVNFVVQNRFTPNHQHFLLIRRSKPFTTEMSFELVQVYLGNDEDGKEFNIVFVITITYLHSHQ